MMKKIFFCKNGGTSFFKKTSLVIAISAKTEGNFFCFTYSKILFYTSHGKQRYESKAILLSY